MIGHLRISQSDADQWQQLLITGQEQNLTATMAHCSTWRDRTFYTYDVESLTRDRDYAVSIGVKNGDVLVNCTCKAAEFSTPCKHIALAVDAAGLWPFPIASQPSMFESAS